MIDRLIDGRIDMVDGVTVFLFFFLIATNLKKKKTNLIMTFG